MGRWIKGWVSDWKVADVMCEWIKEWMANWMPWQGDG